MFDALYLSPHFDDAVLSCGAQIWDRTRRGERVAVVTVCAAPPPPDLSPFAASLHERWSGRGVFDRAAEDREALARLGAVPLHWFLHDCIYRQSSGGQWLYNSEAGIFGKVSAAEAGLIIELARSLEAIELKPDAEVFAPAAIGNHVDHQITRLAAERWRRSLQYYADYPYAEATPGGEVAPVSEEGRRQKILALKAYRSQLSTFWSDEAAMIAKVSQWPERLVKSI
ncbi:MAG: PIG-L family deacetylase [Chloroflexi bacterium]|nr:PIG-L family deacetylase [Chloroflexota bacterium]